MAYPMERALMVSFQYDYRTRAIISRGLYIFYPISKDHFFGFKGFFSDNSFLMYGLYSRAASNQEWLMMARVRYFISTWEGKAMRQIKHEVFTIWKKPTKNPWLLFFIRQNIDLSDNT